MNLQFMTCPLGRRALEQTFQAIIAAPFAALGVRTEEDCLTEVAYLPRATRLFAPAPGFAQEVCAQLCAYLDNPRFAFDLPLKVGGTPFQRQVWQAISEIRSGAIAAYSDLAWQLGSAPRAIGQACGANCVPLIIPCHRVVGRRGLGGFMHAREGEPLAIKRWLLAHEARA